MKHTQDFRDRYDAVIVGARLAGASTALLLARSGLNVLLIERGFPGMDTLSTHALMRSGVLQLDRWGLLDEIRNTDTPAIRSTTFHYGDETIPIAIKSKDGIDALYAPRRTVIDAKLSSAAQLAGVDLRFGTTLQGLEKDRSGRVVGVVVKGSDGATRRIGSSIVVGADGVYSTVAKQVDARTLYTCSQFSSSIYGYFDCIPNDGYQWHYGESAASGLIPTNGSQSCIFASFPSSLAFTSRLVGKDILFERILRESGSSLHDVVRCNPLKNRLMLFHGHPGYVRSCQGPGWALVGDAASFKDPLTAHGMTAALRDAEFIGGAIVEGTRDAMESYESDLYPLRLQFTELSERVASFDWNLPALKELHLSLSKLMSTEYEMLLKDHSSMARSLS